MTLWPTVTKTPIRLSACPHVQEASCAIALNPLAYPGVVVPPPDFNEFAEPPSLTAARHAEKWANNVDPVRTSFPCRVPMRVSSNKPAFAPRSSGVCWTDKGCSGKHACV